MIPPKRFDISPPDWGILRRSRRIQIILKTKKKKFAPENVRGLALSGQTNVYIASSVIYFMVYSFLFCLYPTYNSRWALTC